MNITEKERVREISQIALGGILANPRFYEELIKIQMRPGNGDFPTNAANLAVEYAIALVERQNKII